LGQSSYRKKMKKRNRAEPPGSAQLPGLVVELFNAKALGSVHLRVFQHIDVEIPSPSRCFERPVGMGFPSVLVSFDMKALTALRQCVVRHVGVGFPSGFVSFNTLAWFPSALCLSTQRWWDPFTCLSFDMVALGPSACISFDTAALGTLRLHVVLHGGNGSLCLCVVQHGGIWVPVHPCCLTWKQGTHHVSKDLLAWVHLASYCPPAALSLPWLLTLALFHRHRWLPSRWWLLHWHWVGVAIGVGSYGRSVVSSGSRKER